MNEESISTELLKKVKIFLSENPKAELLSTYLYYIEQKYGIKPVLYPPKKMIYKSLKEAIDDVDSQGKLCHEVQITIGKNEKAVNEETKKIYICPFSGKVFGDNTHPNPQDAIYDWVANCPENKELVGGLRAKRFFVSDDPLVIAEYAKKIEVKEAKVKVVYVSPLTGKLFSSREAVLEDFEKNWVKPLSLEEVHAQSRFKIEDKFLDFFQKQLEEEKVTDFVKAVAEDVALQPHVESWLS
jgi:Protein of unknown function (DUF2709)